MKNFKFTLFPHNGRFVIFLDTTHLVPKYADGFADLFYIDTESDKSYSLQLTKTISIVGVDIT